MSMARNWRIKSDVFSRRTFVTNSVTCAAAAAAALLGLVTQAAAKMAQKAVEYQDTPKGDQQCSNCSLFQEPNSCTLVDGEISPAGWCKFWVKKTG
jgi:anaerobic selenocysteine-containing dehydrogenase